MVQPLLNLKEVVQQPSMQLNYFSLLIKSGILFKIVFEKKNQQNKSNCPIKVFQVS